MNTLTSYVYIISSNTDHLNAELKYITQILNKVNGYLHCFIKKVASHYQKNNREDHIVNQGNKLQQNPKKHTLLLQNQSGKGGNVIKSPKNEFYLTLPENFQTKLVYKATKLWSKFNMKDSIPFEHNHNLIYHAAFPDDNCAKNYVGDSARRWEETVKDQNVRDINSHMLECSIECGQREI